MRTSLSVLLSSLSLLFIVTTVSTSVARAADVKEWTFLIYLNGNNNLDSFGETNIKQMEKVGSTADINIVTQWASLAKQNTQRLYIMKSANPDQVMSPPVQELGAVDMGDWHSVVDFVKWGVANYPAKHYFIDVWDHGSGWHAIRAMSAKNRRRMHALDISWDDNTGHSITTVQLGMALAESAKAIGHKVDLYASDACLMAMAEVADEVAGSVGVFAGSQEVEPGAGWPYDTFLSRWTEKPKSTAAEVSTMLTEEYVSSYNGGENGNQGATFSSFNLAKMASLNAAVSKLGQKIVTLPKAERAAVLAAAKQTQSFTVSDYADFSDFVTNLDSAKVLGSVKDTTSDIRSILNEFVITNRTTSEFAKAWGVSIWLPTSLNTYQVNANNYNTLKFSAHTHWGKALRALF
jgi:hypothetical protein